MANIIRYLERLNNGINKMTVTIVAIAILALIGAIVWFGSKVKDDKIVFGVDQTIDVTPTMVDKMQSIGQWEFLSISDEELIDTIRKGFFSNDELVRIYYGTLRLGIDFSTCTDEWIRDEKDSIVVIVPEIRLLDNNFIDEARTKSFFESGKWANKDRKDMYDRARQRMLKRCLTTENMDKARVNAKEQMQRMLQPIAEPKKLCISFRK